MHLILLQIPYDSGYYNRRMGKGPTHLVEHGLIAQLESIGNKVELFECKLSKKFHTEAGAAKELNTTLAKAIREVRKVKKFPIILAGNCNTAIGVITGLNLTNPGIVWFDAHADFNTPDTSSSGFFDCMGLSILTGNSWKSWRKTIPGFTPVAERNVVLIGARDFGVEELNLLSSSEINLIPVSNLRNEPESVLFHPFEILSKSCEELYIHFDLDAFDPSELKANEFYAEQGLFLSEAKNVLSNICTNFKIAAISFNSYDPESDSDNQGPSIVKSILEVILPHIKKFSR